MTAPQKSQRAMYDEASRKLAEVHETFLEMLPTLRRRDLVKLIEKRPALWKRFEGYLTSGHVFVDDPPAGARHHSTKKSPAQLQREIDEVLAKKAPAPALMTYARKEGLKTYVENGRIKVEGTNAVGKMKKIWGALGADVELDHDGPTSKSWTAKIDGELVGTILFDKSNSFTYSYSVA